MLSLLKAKLLKILLACLSVGAVACSVVDAVLPKDDKSVNKPVTKPTPAAPAIHLDVPTPVSSARLLRRISIDLKSRLPTSDEETWISTGKVSLDSLIDAFLDNDEFNRSMAERHLRMWKLADGKTPDLDRFATNDPVLFAKLTSTSRDSILHEPTYILRKILEDRKPFREIFLVPWTILHDDALTTFGKSAAKTAWLGEPLSFYAYDDARPHFGIFQTWGLHASIDSGESDSSISHTAELLNRFTCKKDPANLSHLFYKLTSENFDAGVSEYAQTEKTCAGCHRRIQAIVPDMAGFFLGTNLTNWLEYSSATESNDSFYSGKHYNNIGELVSLVANDSRVRGCEVRLLFESLLQRPVLPNETDQDQLSLLSTIYSDSNESLRTIVKNIMLSPTYATAVQDASTKSQLLGKHSGVKFLMPSSWSGILSQLNASAGLLIIPHALDAGSEDTQAAEDSVPSNTYYHALRSLATAAAKTIIAEELADGRTRESRVLLSTIPDGSGYTTGSGVIDAQLIDLWDHLTSYHLSATDGKIAALKSLYIAVAATEATSTEQARKGWTYVLTAILMSPEFVTY